MTDGDALDRGFSHRLPGSVVASPALAVLLGRLMMLMPAAEAGLAQGVPGVHPDSLAERFERALRSMDGRAVARQMHPDTLARFHSLIDTLLEVDTDGATWDALLPGVAPDEYRELSSEEVVVRVLASLSGALARPVARPGGP